MTAKRPKICGWGYEGEGLTPEEEKLVLGRYAERFGVDGFERIALPPLGEVALPTSRIAVPDRLRAICSTDAYDRMSHTYGKSFPDYVRIYDGNFENAPDVVAFATSEEDVVAVLDWATGANVAVIPFGGGSSVVGGVEPAVDSKFDGTMSLDLTGLDQIVEIDRTSRAARLQGGLRCPAMEAGLKPHALTMRTLSTKSSIWV